MKNFIAFITISLLILLIGSCEVDDICIENVATPKLIIRFYDTTNTDEVKDVTGLYVWAEAKDTLYDNVTTDSIALPLNPQLNFTKYLLSKDAVVDTLYLYYDRKDIFVSRSCGYKINFELRPETYLSSEWTTDMSMENTPQLIIDETKAHIKIYH